MYAFGATRTAFSRRPGVETGPSVALLPSGLELHGFLLEDLAGHETRLGDEIAARLGEPRAEDLVVLLPDPQAVPLHALLAGARDALGPASIVGAGAAARDSGTALQWCGRDLAEGAVAGLVIRGKRPPRVAVTQACRPVSELLTVTRAQGHWILELDGRPALEVYRKVARGPLAEDLRRAAAFVLAALPRDPVAPLEPGGYLVRNVAGFALEEQALAIPEPVAVGDRIAFVQRDPNSAREDLKAMLASVRDPTRPSGSTSTAARRGSSFFGVPGLEAAYLEQSLAARRSPACSDRLRSARSPDAASCSRTQASPR